MATFAIAEAYAMTRDKTTVGWLRAPLEKAIYFIVATQLQDGGWRYVRGQPYGDMSIFGWMLMAVKSAEGANVDLPSITKLKLKTFLNEQRKGSAGGLAGYRHAPDDPSYAVDDPPSPAMTAEALFCRQMLGLATDQQANAEAVEYLLRNKPRRSVLNLYYWYYGTLAMHQHGGESWDEWNAAMRDLLISEQRQSGPLAGSWDPRGVWGGYGGRVYSTAVATLCLEVYYRYLPLYRLNEK